MATDRLRAWQLLLVDSFPATPRRSALYFVRSGSDHVCKAVGPDGTVYTATGGGGGTLEEWHTGSGAPSGGNDGDLYLDTSSGDVYEKAGGSWSVVCNITGPAGTNGTNGTNGDPGSVWRDGTGAPSGGLGIDGDYYLDDATGDVYLKAAGSYSVVANIKGATGATGAAGANGAPGPNEVTTATDTDLTGILKGNGTKVGTATAGTDYVAPGGALGTPSSGTLTNCTGLPAAGVTGLGDAATKNVGTGSGTVAAGDHTHTAADVGAVPTSRTINGVDLSTDRSLADLGIGTAGLASASPLQCGRLTLTSGVPVTTSDVTGAGTIYDTPFNGDVRTDWDGSNWSPAVHAETAITLSGLTDARPYDVFRYIDGSGVRKTGIVAWTSDSARATAIVLKNGVWVNDASFSTARHNSAGGTTSSGDTVAQYRGVLVGTFRTTSTSTTEDSVLKGFVANVLHPVPRRLRVNDATSHSYNTSTTRPYRNLTTNRVEWVTPVACRAVICHLMAAFQHSNSGNAVFAGIGYDSTTSINTAARISWYGTPLPELGGHTMQTPTAGYHYFQMLQHGSGYATNNYFEATAEALVWL